MEPESAVAQIQCMKSSVFTSKTELIVCMCVMSKRVVKLEDGPAVCFHSRQIGEVFWRGREAAYRLSHCVTHTLTPSETFSMNSHASVCSSGESGHLLSNVSLTICLGYSPSCCLESENGSMLICYCWWLTSIIMSTPVRLGIKADVLEIIEITLHLQYFAHAILCK